LQGAAFRTWPKRRVRPSQPLSAPWTLSQMFEKEERPVERLNRVLVGLVVERLGPSARFLRHAVRLPSAEKAQGIVWHE
jgi:hypothetical protein